MASTVMPGASRLVVQVSHARVAGSAVDVAAALARVGAEVTVVAAMASQARVLKVRVLAAGAADASPPPAAVFFERIFAPDAEADTAGSLSLAAGALGAGACAWPAISRSAGSAARASPFLQ